MLKSAFRGCVVLALSISLQGTSSSLYSQESGPQINLVGVSVTLADADNEMGGSAVMGRSPGVEVHFRIVDEKAFYTGLAEKGGEGVSSLKLFSDDGKELKNEGYSGGIGFGSDISENGQRVTLPFSASSLPAAGTTQLHLRGTVVLVAAKDAATDESSFNVEKGAELKLGNVPVKLSEIEEDPFGEEGLMLSFETNKSLDAIQEIAFMDESGKEIESSSGGGGSFGFGDEMTYSKNFNLKAKPKKIKVRVKYFKSTEQVKVEIDLPVTLSLGK